MDKETLFKNMVNAIVKPQEVWKKELANESSWLDYLKFPILPVIAVVAVISAILTKIFGYHIPVIGTIYPSASDLVLQIAGSIIIFIVSMVVLGYVAAYLGGLFGGKNDMNRAVKMLFLICVPSLAGQILTTLPFVGWVFGIGLGIYSLILLYRAIPEFMEVSADDRVKHFIFFIIAAIVISIVINLSIGRLFTPKDMMQQINSGILTKNDDTLQKGISRTDDASKEKNPIQGYIESMSKGDYNQDIINDSSNDSFTPPKNGRLTKEQVKKFIAYAKKAKIVEKEQAQRLKEKYEQKEKSDDFSISDIFNGLKDVSNLATLEMKVVKSNGGNWAEYQWIKDRVREAYYTPSLNETTKYNAELLKGEEEIIKTIL